MRFTLVASSLQISQASERVSTTRSLDLSVERARFVSGSRAEALVRMGISTVRELLQHIPHRYLDFTEVRTIGTADVGTTVTVIARVDKVTSKRPRPNLDIVQLDCVDQTGVMRIVFFKQRWLADRFKRGMTVAFSGKVKFNYGFKEMNTPFFEIIDDGSSEGAASKPELAVLPVHPVSEGLSANWMRRIMSAAVADFADCVDPFDSARISKLGLMSEARAYRSIHFPHHVAEAEEARRRLAFDELMELQIALQLRKELELAGIQACQHVIDGSAQAALRASLPFALTDEQEQATQEILADMASTRPMRRLLLGDVGTGKTAVAAVALAAVADTGTQAAVMAPTSVLAGQYAAKIGPLLDACGISWRLLLGSTPASERAEAQEGLATGAVSVAFGTTALLSEGVDFANLSLVVVDEQHRFGVNQRSALRDKGRNADLLTMSATPIPRTLALSVYGDVSTSRIRHRPVEGAGISTKLITFENVDLAYGAIRDAVDAGQQAYVVCPLVEPSDTEASDLDAGMDEVPDALRVESKKIADACTTQERLARDIFPNYTVGLLHGRMSGAEKDKVMADFRDGTIQVLVSTTVIEVGVDVPNATVMLILDADRFGLATLHQLRGRVGRGSIAGEVFLESGARKGSASRDRLQALEHTSDGFELAQLDLRLRREGDVLGYRQSGGAILKLVDLESDEDLIDAAHAYTAELLEEDPSLTEPQNRLLAHEVYARYGSFFERVD